MYFEEKLNTVWVGTKQYPVKLDMFVLEKIQEQYGTIHNFELNIKGYKEIRDEEGKLIGHDRVEPDIKTINFVLPLMIREGCEIEDVDLPYKTDKKIMIDIVEDYRDLQDLIVQEFNKCFKTSKKE